MSTEYNEYKQLATRTHKVTKARDYQNYINKLAWKGGTPYIEERLSRFAAEDSVSWEGGKSTEGNKITGRKERAYVPPYLERIVQKINDYIFSIEPERENIQPEIEDDISSNGNSINALMAEVSSLLTVNKWCWIGTDAPAIDIDAQISQADKIKYKVRPYATVYGATQVRDWYINAQGVIEWLITETTEYIATNPLVEAQEKAVRRLWEPGKVTILEIDGEKIKNVEEIMLSINEVPFILCGEISDEPAAFDNLESINRSILDLSSASFANYFSCVYPQLFLPASVLDTVMQTYNMDAQSAVSMIRGYSHPILLANGDVEPGYISPDNDSIESMRTEISALKNELYESVGMLLRSESKVAESAESKAFDHLDLEMLIRARSQKLEDIEDKLAIMLNKWDSSIPIYTVSYNKTLQIEDEVKDIKDDVKEDIKDDVKDDVN